MAKVGERAKPAREVEKREVAALRALGQSALAKTESTRTPQQRVAEASLGLSIDDFSGRQIDYGKIRAVDPRSEEQLSGVFKAVKKDSPGRLLRAFPNVYYSDLKDIDRARIPGGDGVVMGDSHPGNFGWVLVEGKSVFGPNDLDDAGKAPVALDAAHYFTAVEQLFTDKALTQRLRDKYIQVVFDPSAAVKVDPALAPDWSENKRDLLDNHTKNDHRELRHEGDMPPIKDNAVKAAIKEGIAPFIDGADILDMSVREKETGGSGGYARYWVLINHEDADGKKRKEIIELKQAGPPGVASFDSNQPKGDARMAQLKAAFWRSTATDDHVDVQIAGTHFELRRKTRMQGMDVEKMDAPEREQVLMAQVSFLADLHRPAWRGTERGVMSDWLGQSQRTLVSRWKTAFGGL